MLSSTENFHLSPLPLKVYQFLATLSHLSSTEEKERERVVSVKVLFKKYIWEIRTGNPSLAVKILNDANPERERVP